MRREDLQELCYITPIENVTSIVQRGLLSAHRVQAVQHRSIAMPEIQGLRDGIVVPGGRPLHDYVNLYVCARNPTMMKMVRKYAHHSEVCVLRVSPDVLDTGRAVVTDGNAASSGYARFEAAPDGLSIVDKDRAFAIWWTSTIPAEYYRRKFQKCAEVLVPDRVSADYLMGAYVSGEAGCDRFTALNTELTVTINAHLFFQ